MQLPCDDVAALKCDTLIQDRLDNFEQEGVVQYLNWKQFEEEKHTQTIESVLHRYVYTISM